MARLSASRVSRRTKAIKEKTKAAPPKSRRHGEERAKEGIAGHQEQSIGVMEASNKHTQGIQDNLITTMELADAEVALQTAAAAASTRTRRIEVFEKQLLLGLGDKQSVAKKLKEKLEAQWAD